MDANSTTIGLNVVFNDVIMTYQNTDYYYHNENDNNNNDEDDDDDSVDVVVLKAFAIVIIITAAVVGNSLVIISVWKYDRLRIMANVFIVSLAMADLLVALLVMPFSASQELTGRWLFGRVVCDVFNANDVLFSTASLLHLCCISMDRYIAITDPFGYADRMTRRRAAATLGSAWTAAGLLSHVPIHLGLYTTRVQQESLGEDECSFRVNRVYGVVSSTVSFWTPATVMVFTYVKIYREARRQERHIAALSQRVGRLTLPEPFPSGGGAGACLGVGGGGGGSASSRSVSASQLCPPPPAVVDGQRSPTRSGEDHEKKRQMRREHKAAKTLGMVMGAFLLCWLPFFTWYLTSSLCQDRCDTPTVCISALFWIGYTNSALNPVIYACFNRDFRFAFRKLVGYDRCFRRLCCPGENRTTERTCLKTNSTELDNLTPNHQIH